MLAKKLHVGVLQERIVTIDTQTKKQFSLITGQENTGVDLPKGWSKDQSSTVRMRLKVRMITGEKDMEMRLVQVKAGLEELSIRTSRLSPSLMKKQACSSDQLGMHPFDCRKANAVFAWSGAK